MTEGMAQGQCSERFAPIRDLFNAQISSGADLGASLAITVDGAFEVDLWGGWADAAQTRRWEADTVVNVWSTTKMMTSLAALILIDRGELDVDAPVAKYWPEFAANGKAAITVRQVMSWTSGVSGWDSPMTVEEIYDWDRSTTRLATQAPWWTPGSATGYSLVNYGHLVGEVVRRVTGRGLKQFFTDEIARPLDADFHIGLPESEVHRCSPVIPPPPLPIDMTTLDQTSVMFKTFTGPWAADAENANTPAWRAADIGGANGHGNARSVARIQSVISNGGEAFGVRLLKPITIERIFETHCRGTDLVLGLPLHMGLGWALPEPALLSYVPQGRVCFWGGWGGSMIINDADHHVTMAYAMNRMASGIIGSDTSTALLSCAYQLLR